MAKTGAAGRAPTLPTELRAARPAQQALPLSLAIVPVTDEAGEIPEAVEVDIDGEVVPAPKEPAPSVEAKPTQGLEQKPAQKAAQKPGQKLEQNPGQTLEQKSTPKPDPKPASDLEELEELES